MSYLKQLPFVFIGPSKEQNKENLVYLDIFNFFNTIFVNNFEIRNNYIKFLKLNYDFIKKEVSINENWFSLLTQQKFANEEAINRFEKLISFSEQVLIHSLVEINIDLLNNPNIIENKIKNNQDKIENLLRGNYIEFTPFIDPDHLEKSFFIEFLKAYVSIKILSNYFLNLSEIFKKLLLEINQPWNPITIKDDKGIPKSFALSENHEICYNGKNDSFKDELKIKFSEFKLNQKLLSSELRKVVSNYRAFFKEWLEESDVELLKSEEAMKQQSELEELNNKFKWKWF